MNKIVRALVEVPTGAVKATVNNLIHGCHISPIAAINPFGEITIDQGGKCSIGRWIRIRAGGHVRVRRGAVLSIGENVSINHGCMVVCHDCITIGNDVQFSPNVMVYDHDHDYKAKGGLKSMKYKVGSVKIGNNVWIGANSIILRGTSIGDNCVIAAGSVVKGNIPPGCLYYNKRQDNMVRVF